VNLIIPIKRDKWDFVNSERRFLKKAMANYFALITPDIRRYKPSEKEFTWVDDVWPFYRQSMEHNYSGPVISEQ
jgi:hypothetical protein